MKADSLFLAGAAAVLLSGCVSQRNLVALARELSRDPATVGVQVMTPYGSMRFVRTNPLTNSPPYSVNPDGAVKVGP